MNKIDNYIVWQMIKDQPRKMVVVRLCDDDEGLTIFLKDSLSVDNTRLLKLLFDPYISYKNMNESYRARTFDDHPYGLKNTSYTVNGSLWLNWFHEESKNIYSDRYIVHYSIITISDCIDILSEFPPVITWIEEKRDQGVRLVDL